MTKHILWAALATFLVGAALFTTARATAQDHPRSVVVELPVQTIVGQRQQPGAIYVLNRTEAGYEVTELRTTFVPELVRSTTAAPF